MRSLTPGRGLAPGSFVTADVIDDLHRNVEASERTQSETLRSVRYFVHIQTHGEVRPGPGSGGTGGLATLEVVPGSQPALQVLGDVGLQLGRPRHDTSCERCANCDRTAVSRAGRTIDW